MNIKKIIREELDDFDWIRGVNPLSYDILRNKGLKFDPPINNQEQLDHVIKTLRGLGFTITFNNSLSLIMGGVLGLFIRMDGKVVWTSNNMTSSETYQQHINRFTNSEIEVLDGRTLFSI